MQAFDLNLLPVVQALLEEESVTRAAARVHLSVPATSRALERARHMFGDPLLVRSGRSVTMTPRARQLLPQLQQALSAVSTVLDRPDDLAPDRIVRSFTIRGNEAVIAAAGAHLVQLANREAPRSEIRFELETADDMAALRRGDVDLAIGSYGDITGDIETERLLDERIVAVVRHGHPSVTARSRPSVTRFAALDHIVVSRKGRRRNIIDQLLSAHGHERNVVAVVPSFAVALAMVARSDATTFAPARLASILLEHRALVAFTSPLTLPSVTIAQLWHASNSADQSHQWLRSCVRRAAIAVQSKPPSS
jgi:DNA-binding transcriptional LysR family regulator